jgi:hypothetical protein
MLFAACSGQFTVCVIVPELFSFSSDKLQEATSGRVKFPEQDPDIMSRVILWLYAGYYDPGRVPNFQTPFPDEKHEAWLAQHTQDERRAEYDKTKYSRLKTRVRVYACADMLGIEYLKYSAASSSISSMRSCLAEKEFVDILRLVYDCTHPDDDALRLPVITLCLEQHAVLSPEVTKFMQENEPTLWKVALPLTTTLTTSLTRNTSPTWQMRSVESTVSYSTPVRLAPEVRSASESRTWGNCISRVSVAIPCGSTVSKFESIGKPAMKYRTITFNA